MKLGDLFIKLGIQKQDFDKGITDAKKKTTDFSSGLKKIGGMMAAAFSVAALTSFVSGIVNVRKEFEKYQAVLKNTFGNDKEAKQSMNDLKQFASETPFALSELTGAYVKLVNYGLKPSMAEMRKYGDLASSVGKGFDQLTEAIADATTGQFERLKEFGIKAAKEGDKVTFTFKGQSQTVANTSTAIKDYILSLGDMQGVSGSMAAISQTLGGRISNLGDAWDSLMNTLGKGSSGVMVDVIRGLTAFVGMLDNAFSSVNDLKEAARLSVGSEAAKSGIAEVSGMAKKFQAGGMGADAAQAKAFALYRDSMNTTVQELRKQYEKASGDRKKDLGNKIADMLNEYNAVKKNFTKIEDEKTKIVTKSAKERLAELKKIEDEAEAARILKQEFRGESLSAITPIGTPENVGTNTIDTSQLANMDSHYKAVAEKHKKFTEEYLEVEKQFNSDLNNIIQSGMADAATTMGEGIGSMLTDDMGWSDFGKTLLGVVGKFLVQFGQLVIGYALAAAGLEAAIKMPGAWPVALAAGIALVAIGSAISNLSSKGLSGSGGGGGGASAASVGGKGASGYSGSGYQGSNAAAAMAGNVTFEIKGTVLQGVLNNNDRKNSIIR